MDLLWLVGGEPDEPGREELRYSLRSYAANFRGDLDNVWVVGDPPGWLSSEVRTIRLTPHPCKPDNQRQSLTQYVSHRDAAGTFALLNDDFLLTEPTDVPPVVHRSRHSTWSTVHKQSVMSSPHQRDCWQCCIVDTLDWVTESTGSDPWVYENHAPLIFDTALVRDVLATYPTDARLAIACLYPLAGAGGEGVVGGNAKCKQPDSFASKIALDLPYLSCSPDTWRGVVGAHIKPMFPDKCRWEA